MLVGFKIEGKVSVSPSVATELAEGTENALERAIKEELGNCIESSAFPPQDVEIAIGAIEEGTE